MGTHHHQYRGHAFYMERSKLNRFPVNGRIMIDAALFQDVNPNYVGPRIDVLVRQNPSGSGWIIMGSEDISAQDRIKSNNIEPGTIVEDELLLCSSTVSGWSLSDKRWGGYSPI